MNDQGDTTMTQWVVGGVSAGVVAIITFLARFVFGGVMKRLDEMKVELDRSSREHAKEMRDIASTVNAQITTLALLEARCARIESDATVLRIKVEDTQGWLQASGFGKRDSIE